MRTNVAPSSIAISKSSLMPIERSLKLPPTAPARRASSRKLRRRRKKGRASSGLSENGGTAINPLSSKLGSLPTCSQSGRASPGAAPVLDSSPPRLTSMKTWRLLPDSAARRSSRSASLRSSTDWTASKSSTARRALFDCRCPIRCHWTLRSALIALSSLILAAASWMRLSPSVRTPASMASRMRAAGTVLLTATSVISEACRPARSHAAAIRRLISSSRALKSLFFLSFRFDVARISTASGQPPRLFFVLRFDVALTVLNNEQLRIDLIAPFDLDLDLATLALPPGVGRRVTQAVFVAHQRLDRLQRAGDFARESDRDVFAAGRIGEGLQRVFSLQKGHPVERDAADVSSAPRIVILVVLLHEQLARAEHVDRHPGILDDLSRLVEIDLAECVEAGSDEEDRRARVDFVKPGVVRLVVLVGVLAVFQNHRVSLAAAQDELQGVEHVAFGESRVVADEQTDRLHEFALVVGEIDQRSGADVVSDDRDEIFRLYKPVDEFISWAKDFDAPGFEKPARAGAEDVNQLAVFQQQHHRHRGFGRGEVFDLLFYAVFINLEMFLLQSLDDAAGLFVVDDRFDVDHVSAYGDCGRRDRFIDLRFRLLRVVGIAAGVGILLLFVGRLAPGLRERSVGCEEALGYGRGCERHGDGEREFQFPTPIRIGLFVHGGTSIFRVSIFAPSDQQAAIVGLSIQLILGDRFGYDHS